MNIAILLFLNWIFFTPPGWGPGSSSRAPGDRSQPVPHVLGLNAIHMAGCIGHQELSSSSPAGLYCRHDQPERDILPQPTRSGTRAPAGKTALSDAPAGSRLSLHLPSSVATRGQVRLP
jgi:hypothetical protein